MTQRFLITFCCSLSIFFGGCNYSITSVASTDPDILRVNRPHRLQPTCLNSDISRISKIELIDLKNQEATLINPIFNANGLFWTPTSNLNGRYRFRFTCEGKLCFSPAFVVDGALSITGKPLRYPKEDTSSIP